MSSAILSWIGFTIGLISMIVWMLVVFYKAKLRFVDSYFVLMVWLIFSVVIMASALLVHTTGSVTVWMNEHLSDLFWGSMIVVGLYSIGVIWSWPESKR